MSFMDVIYKKNESEEISPDKSKDKVKEQMENDPYSISVNCLDCLEEYEPYDYFYDDDYSSKKNKKKKKKQAKKRAAEKEALRRKNEELEKRVLAIEAKNEVFTQLFSAMLGGKKQLENENFIRMSDEEYKDV